MKNKLLINFFSSGLQAIALQILGVVFFYFISLYLPKDSFGIINWANAVSLFLTTLLSFGMEQVVIRRVASSRSSGWAAAAFFLHALAGSAIMFFILLGLSVVSKNASDTYRLLPWFFIPQALIFIGVPLKQFLNARECFTPYGVIAFISNVIKIVAAYVVMRQHLLSLGSVIWILTGCALFELLALFIYLKQRTDFNLNVRLKAYKKLLKESVPQYIATLFDSSLSRMDWILLGLISTNVVMADYSFAYKAYEVAKLPIVIIGPLILPRLARAMVNTQRLDAAQQHQVDILFGIEMFFAVLIPLCLNIVWQPAVTTLTHGKYGSSNTVQFLLLSLSIPLQLVINLLWSLSFTARKYKAVSVITIISAASNIILNLIFIPFYQGMGAAIAFLITMFLQAGIYYWFIYRSVAVIRLRPLVLFSITALAAYLLSAWLFHNFALQLVAAILLYILAALVTRQIARQHLQTLRAFIKR